MKREDIILLVQRILVLMGSVSNTITQERRQIAWSRLNPLIRDISTEEDTKGKKSVTLFGGGFMERPLRGWRKKRPYLKSLALRGKPHQPSINDMPIFWRRAHLHSTAAGSTSVSSCTARTTTPSEVTNNNWPDHPGSRPNNSEHFCSSRLSLLCAL